MRQNSTRIGQSAYPIRPIGVVERARLTNPLTKLSRSLRNRLSPAIAWGAIDSFSSPVPAPLPASVTPLFQVRELQSEDLAQAASAFDRPLRLLVRRIAKGDG